MAGNRYTTAGGFKAALEARLKLRSAELAEDLNRVRRRLILERFMVRLGEELGDALTLKGGLALELRLERARSTKDLDLHLFGAPDQVLTRLQQAGRRDASDYMTFEVTVDAQHPTIEAEGLPYQGRRFRVQGLLAAKPYGGPFGVDVAFAEELFLPVEELPGSDVLVFAALERPTFRVYPLEIHIAEKLHAYTMPRDNNTRVKDLPDLVLLSAVRDIDAAQLCDAILRRFAQRGTHAVPRDLPPPPASWAAPYARMAREHRLHWSTLEEVTAAAQAFLDPVLAAGSGRWSAQHARWEFAAPSGSEP